MLKGHPDTESMGSCVGPRPRAGQPVSFVLAPLLRAQLEQAEQAEQADFWQRLGRVTASDSCRGKGGDRRGECLHSKAITSPGHVTRRTNSALRLRPPPAQGGGSSLCSKAVPDCRGAGTPLPASSHAELSVPKAPRSPPLSLGGRGPGHVQAQSLLSAPGGLGSGETLLAWATPSFSVLPWGRDPAHFCP